MTQICLLRCFRPDRVTVGAQTFIISKMGDKYVQPPVLNFAKVPHPHPKPSTLNPEP